MTQFNKDSTGEEVVRAFPQLIEGKAIIITGPSTGGIGGEAAISVAHAGPKLIILAGRTESKIQPVIEKIRVLNQKIATKFVKLDLSDFASVRRAADDINASVEKVDVLINNAGIMAVNPYKKSVDGIEIQFAANHVGHFLLTNLIMEKVINAGPGARIVNVSSAGYELGPVRWDDWNFSVSPHACSYRPTRLGWENVQSLAGIRTVKDCQHLFSLALAKRLQSKGVLSYSAHPGLIMETNLLESVSPEMLADGYKLATEANDGVPVQPPTPKSVQQGCETILVAALDPSIEASSGAYLVDGQTHASVKPYVSDPANANKLWKLSEELVGQTFSY